MLYRPLALISLWLSFLQAAFAASRTSPPEGALVVRAGTTNHTEYKTISAAVAALPKHFSSQCIFVYPGTYYEQVYIKVKGEVTIYGYTTNTRTHSSNRVTIQSNVPATEAGSNDASGTLRIHTDNFKMYNVNVRNDFGQGNGAHGQNQAIAISQSGNQVGFYACGFYGYQDTLLAGVGNQVYLKGHIEGAVDFIFGRRGSAYFWGNTLAVNGPGTITASGRETPDDVASGNGYVFESNTIALASGAAAGTVGRVFLGRPWGDYAKVVFKDTIANVALNKTIWSAWQPGVDPSANVFFADHNSKGVGFEDSTRADFATALTAHQAAAYNISSVVGSDYASWVDTSYLV